MSQAAYVKKVKIDGNNAEFSSAAFTEQGDDLDATNMKANGGYRQHLVGLLDAPFSGTLQYTPADAAFAALKTALRARTTVALQYLPNGTAGVSVTCAVLSMNQSGDVGGLETVEVSLVPTTAPVDV